MFLGPIPERDGLNLRVEDAGAGHTVIELAKRGGRYVVRPRHPLNPLLTGYRGTPAYAPSPEYAISGIFVPFAEPRPTTVGAAVEGIHHVYEAPGEIRFRLRGKDLSLTAFNGHTPGTLSVLFTDATSGKSTYAANRSLTVPAPGADGTVCARLQPGGEPAVRLHGPRHVPAAAGREPPAGGHRSRRTDPLRTTGRIMSTHPAQDGPRGHGLLLLELDGAGSHPAAWRVSRTAPASVLDPEHLRGAVLAAESAGFHAATFSDPGLPDPAAGPSIRTAGRTPRPGSTPCSAPRSPVP